jgi:hypothetical protein
VWLVGLGQLKNPMISSGIEPATFWLVAWCLNHLHYCVSLYAVVVVIIVVLKYFFCKEGNGTFVRVRVMSVSTHF